MKLLAAIFSVFIFSSFSTNVAQQKPDCETYTIGGVKIINQTNHAVSGRICLKKVDKRTGRIHPEFCPEFSLSIGGETEYREMLEGNAAYTYMIAVPDPDNFKKEIYANQKQGGIYIESCKTVQLVLK